MDKDIYRTLADSRPLTPLFQRYNTSRAGQQQQQQQHKHKQEQNNNKQPTFKGQKGIFIQNNC